MPRLQRGSNSPLSGLPDHTLHNGHTMLRSGGASRHQGALYRSEHRRSLTSGLTAIPEDEDAADSGGGSDGGPVANRRHSMPAAPQAHGVGGRVPRGVGVGDQAGAGGGFSSAGVGSHSHASTDLEKHRDRCSSNVARQQLPPSSHTTRTPTAGAGGEEHALPLLSAAEMMHVSWKTPCQRTSTNSASPCQDCRPVPVSTAHWPVLLPCPPFSLAWCQ